jgi:hypothetical protein
VTGTREEEKELGQRSFKDILGADSDGDDDARRVREELQIVDGSTSSEDGSGGGGGGGEGSEEEEERNVEEEEEEGVDVGNRYQGGKKGREERRRIAMEKARLHSFDSDDGSDGEEGTGVDKVLSPSWLRGDGKVVRQSDVADGDDDDDDDEEEEEDTMMSEGGVREREDGSGRGGREGGGHDSSVDSEVEEELLNRPQPGRYNPFMDQHIYLWH